MPQIPDERTIFGSISCGNPNTESRSGSHSPVARFISMVRDALVGSVTCEAPFVSFQMSHVSTLPNNRSRGWAPVASMMERILLAEKYASMIKPVFVSIISRGFNASQ